MIKILADGLHEQYSIEIIITQLFYKTEKQHCISFISYTLEIPRRNRCNSPNVFVSHKGKTPDISKS